MALTIHILLILTGLLITGVSCRRFGDKTSLGRVLVGFVLGLCGVMLAGVTVVLYPEGNSSPLPFLLGGCIWLITSLVPNALKAGLLCIVLCVLFLGLSFQHLGLVGSGAYTDNPEARQSAIHGMNERAAKEGTPLQPHVRIEAHWYTLLTGLYSVEPPVSGHP